MTEHRRRLLHVVTRSQPVDELLAALDDWRDATACGGGEPGAYLEVSDDEITGDGWLTAAQVLRLARLLLADAPTGHADRGAAR